MDVEALWDCMSRLGFGAARFAVFDGGREGGVGRLGRRRGCGWEVGIGGGFLVELRTC